MSRSSAAARGARLAGNNNDDFPTIMQSQDLMALVQSGAPILELRSIVQFPNFKPGSPSLADFLDTFPSNRTTHTIKMSRHFTTGFSDEEFCQILCAFGRLRHLRNITFVDGGDSRLRRLHLAEVARLIRNSPQLQTVILGRYWLLTGNDGERAALARALAHHPQLRVFHFEGCGVQPPAQQPGGNNNGNSNNSSVPLQLYQAIAPRADPDAVLDALATCPRLRSVRITHSPYCARDYSVAALARLCCGNRLRECSVVTRVANWAPLLAEIRNNNNNNNNNALATAPAADMEANAAAAAAAGSSCCLERLALATAEHGLTSVDTLGPVAAQLGRLPHVRQLSLRFWGGPFQPLRDTSAALAHALRVNPCLRILEVSEGGGRRRAGSSSSSSSAGASSSTAAAATTTTQSRRNSATSRRTTNAARTANDGDEEDQENNLETNVPPKAILPAGTHPSLRDSDFAILETALRHNPRLQLRLDVGVAAAHEDAYDRLRIQSNLNAVGRFSAASSTTGMDAQRHDSSSSWFDAFSTLERLCRNDTEEFLQSCLFRFMRSNPQYWCR